jgi:ESF2/ABP1 family protein
LGLGLCAYLCYRASQLLTNCCGQHTNNVFELRWSERTRCSRFASCRLALNSKHSIAMTRGVVYLSRIPPHLRPGKVRRLLEQHGEITNLYLAAANKTREDKKKYGRGKRFVEGWVEFAEKKIAKRVAASLNGERMGRGSRDRHADDLWSMKYLRGFEWRHLTEKQAYDRKVEESRQRLADAAAKREVGEFQALVDERDRNSAMEKRKRRKLES